MDDALEKFIRKNRSAFDEEFSSLEAWETIRQHTVQPSKRTGWWKIAAVLFLISSIGLLIERQWVSSEEQFAQKSGGEFVEVERYYTQIIQVKKNELIQFSNHPLKQDFLTEIEQLDQQYLQLKKTFSHQSPSGKLTDAMIRNLQLRIDILNKQLAILTQLKDYNHEAIIEL